MDAREKEQYLREYSILKSQGKPFFPYAVAKDGAMACVVARRDHHACRSCSAPSSARRPTRPRPPTRRGPSGTSSSCSSCCASIKPPALVFLATIGIPTICLVLLLLLPFYRPQPRAATRCGGRSRPPPASRRSRAMAYLTILGATAGSPTEIDMQAARHRQLRNAARQVMASVRLPGLPQDRRERQRRARAEPDRDRRQAAAGTRSRGRSMNPTAPMPSYQNLPAAEAGEVQRSSSQYVASARRASDARSAPASGTLPEHAGAGDVRPHRAASTTCMNSVMTAGMHHRWRERAADLARVGPGDRALDVATGTGDLAIELARASARRRGDRLGLLRGDARARARARRRAARASSRATRSSWPTPDDAFDAATVGFGARNFADLDAGLARDGARRAAGRPRRRARDHDAAASRRCRRSSALWFDRVVPLLGTRRRRPRGLHLPAELACRRFPGPRGAGRGAWPRGARATCAGSSPRAGSSRSTRGRCRMSDRRRRSRPAGARGGRRAASPALLARARGAARARSRPATATTLGRARRRRRSPRAASGCGRCSCFSAAGERRPATRAGARRGRGRARPHGDARPRRRARRAPTCAAAGRRSFASGGRATRPPRPATCCSRARSRSWPRNGERGRRCARSRDASSALAARRAAAARRRLERRRDARALPRSAAS